jgi:hypothetical protein
MAYINLGSYKAIFEREPEIRVNRLEIQSNGEIEPSSNSATPKASGNFDNLKSSLEGLAQLGWLQEESSWFDNFTLDPSELSDLDRLDQVVKALLDRARRVAPGFSVPMMVPRVVVESMPAAAGQFEVDEEGWVTIRVSPDFERDLPAARAILAHEVCHYILENRGIRQPNFELNERDTDLCMFICGSIVRTPFKKKNGGGEQKKQFIA